MNVTVQPDPLVTVTLCIPLKCSVFLAFEEVFSTVWFPNTVDIPSSLTELYPEREKDKKKEKKKDCR